MKSLPFILTFFIMFTSVSAQTDETELQGHQHLKPCLVIIDIQNDYLPYIPERDKKLGLQMINAAIYMFREKGFPVIRVYHTDPKWGPKPDSVGFQFPESVMIQESDPKVVKNYPSAFKKTDLEKIVREKDCNTLFLCGLSAVGCVLATYHTGKDLDFNVFMIKNAIMSHNSEYTRFVEEIFDTVSYTGLKVMLDYSSE
jgi:nicotinamidase-related amidase